MQLQTKAQQLLHVEQYTYKKKNSDEISKIVRLHFADPSTSRVSNFAYKGDISTLVIGTHYVLDVRPYNLEGRSGLALISLSRAE